MLREPLRRVRGDLNARNVTPPNVGERMMNAVVAKKPMRTVCCFDADMMNLPRCEMRVERCDGGCKIYCSCDDAEDRRALQAAGEKMAGKLCSVSCSLHGEPICHCTFNCCDCTCECTRTAEGMCLTCVSCDPACCEMVQAICDCIARCQECGCDCMLHCGETPICVC